MDALEECHFPFLRGKNSTECDVTFIEAYPITTYRIRFSILFSGILVLFASSKWKLLSFRILFYRSNKFSEEDIIVRSNVYTLLCGTIACILFL
eukprot:snap_masked-scaffold_25-processed-gene-1.17-mRNA-1 protein AED:1.00 eAED:1.00 QI:0/0/0/0/1/1/3/0/93